MEGMYEVAHGPAPASVEGPHTGLQAFGAVL